MKKNRDRGNQRVSSISITVVHSSRPTTQRSRDRNRRGSGRRCGNWSPSDRCDCRLNDHGHRAWVNHGRDRFENKLAIGDIANRIVAVIRIAIAVVVAFEEVTLVVIMVFLVMVLFVVVLLHAGRVIIAVALRAAGILAARTFRAVPGLA